VQEGILPSTPTANLLTGLEIDEFLVRTDVAGARYLLADALGSTLALTDSLGAVSTEYTYEPFGGSTPSGASSASAYQYTGRENDGTGLYYSRARYYQALLMRFVSEDPAEFLGGDVNLYAYVWNSPTEYADPLGLGGIIVGGQWWARLPNGQWGGRPINPQLFRPKPPQPTRPQLAPPDAKGQPPGPGQLGEQLKNPQWREHRPHGPHDPHHGPHHGPDICPGGGICAGGGPPVLGGRKPPPPPPCTINDAYIRCDA
jgi:RHS repeat-associated protein